MWVYKECFKIIQDKLVEINVSVDSDNSSKNVNDWVITILNAVQDEMTKIAHLNKQGKYKIVSYYTSIFWYQNAKNIKFEIYIDI